jgi:hypothetical protein
MNAVSAPEQGELSLVDIIDFKWLMAGAGLDVHVERMQAEPAYARECLCRGACSDLGLLRETARRLARTLGVALAPVRG